MQEMKKWIALIIALTLTLPLTAQTVEWDVRGPNGNNTNTTRNFSVATTGSDYDEAAQDEGQTEDDTAKNEEDNTEEESD